MWKPQREVSVETEPEDTLILAFQNCKIRPWGKAFIDSVITMCGNVKIQKYGMDRERNVYVQATK